MLRRMARKRACRPAAGVLLQMGVRVTIADSHLQTGDDDVWPLFLPVFKLGRLGWDAYVLEHPFPRALLARTPLETKRATGYGETRVCYLVYLVYPVCLWNTS